VFEVAKVTQIDPWPVPVGQHTWLPVQQAAPPPQTWLPGGHTQVPFWQLNPGGQQLLPHATVPWGQVKQVPVAGAHA